MAKSEKNIDKLLSSGQAATALNLKQPTIRAWTQQRRIPFVRLGRRVMYRARDLQQMIDDGFTPALTTGGQGK